METHKHLIYIVEDSPIIAGILNKVVTQFNEVTTKLFEDGISMLNELQTDNPDLILLDYYLHNKKDSLSSKNENNFHGDLIIKEIKKVSPSLPIILVSRISDEQKLQEIKLLGVDLILHKDDDDVFNKVLQFIESTLFSK